MDFINYEKVLDSVKTSAFMQGLMRQRVEETHVKIIEDIYEESTATIRLHKISHKVSIQKGIRHDNTNSPKLFTAF